MTAAAEKLRAYLDGPVWAAWKVRAKVVREQLRSSIERLNDGLSLVEEALVDRFAGMCAAVEFDEDHALVFWKVKGAWGLYILGDDGRLQPLPSASLRHRKEAVGLLPDLVIQLQEEAA